MLEYLSLQYLYYLSTQVRRFNENTQITIIIIIRICHCNGIMLTKIVLKWFCYFIFTSQFKITVIRLELFELQDYFCSIFFSCLTDIIYYDVLIICRFWVLYYYGKVFVIRFRCSLNLVIFAENSQISLYNLYLVFMVLN